MAYRGETTRDEYYQAGAAQTAGASLFKIAGGWGNGNGPGMFMLRVIVSGSTMATMTGLLAGGIGNLIWGTSALPFITAACVGFVFGAVRWYRDALKKALISLDYYPALLRLHLDANYPSERFRKWGLEAFRSERFKSLQLQSMLVVAWLTASDALDQVMKNDEDALVAEEKEKADQTDLKE